MKNKHNFNLNLAMNVANVEDKQKNIAKNRNRGSKAEEELIVNA